MSGTAEEFGEGYRLQLPGGLDTVRVFRAEYVDEPGLPLARYDFVVDILDADKPQRFKRAGKIYKQLVERTSWDTLWLTGNGQTVANQRSALVA